MRRSYTATAAASFLAFCVGTILAILPWSVLWDNNHFFDYVPLLKPLFLTRTARAGISVLGLFDLFIGLTEARHLGSEDREPPGEP